MNMLIIGNGFDLAHERPTKYGDFLKFAEYIYLSQSFNGSRSQFQERLTNVNMHPEVKSYILKAFDSRVESSNSVTNENDIIQQLYNCLNNNV